MKEVLERRRIIPHARGCWEGSTMEAHWNLRDNRMLMGKMTRRGNGVPGLGNSVSENMETRESGMFREFFVGLGGWKGEGKWKDVESLTL